MGFWVRGFWEFRVRGFGEFGEFGLYIQGLGVFLFRFSGFLGGVWGEGGGIGVVGLEVVSEMDDGSGGEGSCAGPIWV